MTFLYRTHDSDDDGDPFDHGIVSAVALEQAIEFVRLRLTQIREEGRLNVRFYPQEQAAEGVWQDAGAFTDVRIAFPR